MRNWMSYGFVCSLICILLLGCINKEEECEPQWNIFFRAAVDEIPTVSKPTVQYPNDLPFRVWGYKLPSEMTWRSEHGQAQPLFDDIQAMYHNGFWHTAQLHLWPESEYKMNFFAFAPSASNATYSLENGVEFKQFSIKENSDFLYADPVLNMIKPEKDAPVQLIFRSPLSNVVFQAYAVSTDNITVKVTGLKLKELNTTGWFKQYIAPYWFELGGKEECRIFEGEIQLQENVSFIAEKLIIPQKLVPVINYQYHVNGTFTDVKREVVLDTQMFPQPQFGGKTVYTIKVSPD